MNWTLREEIQHVLRFAEDLPPEQLPRLLGEIEEVRCTAMARLSAIAVAHPANPDHLISVADAAQLLGVSKDTLYRQHDHFPFTRRMGRRLLFSSHGIEDYIFKQSGLAHRSR